MLKQNSKPMAIDDTPKGRQGIDDMLKRLSEMEDEDDNSTNKETA